MIELKPFGNGYVPTELASKFIGLTHLSTDECLKYLITSIVKGENEEKLYLDVERAILLFNYLNYPPMSFLGSGIIKILDDVHFGEIQSIQSHIAALEQQARTIYESKNVPGYSEEERLAIHQEHLSSMYLVLSYLFYILSLHE